MATFKELGLSDQAVAAITSLGYESPTPIQEQAIPALLGGADVIGQAQTGTGKTAAFGLPLLETIDPGVKDVQALVLTPTRELCIQVTQALRGYGEARGIDVVGVFGGAPIRSQQAQLRSGGHVVVGTVGRVLDLISRNSLVLHAARFVVLDEADEMLDLGFLEDVEKILRSSPSGRQTALFSATMPDAIKRLAGNYMYDPQTIRVQAPTLTIDTVEHFFIQASKREKAKALAAVIDKEDPRQVIVFVRTKISAEKLKDKLNDAHPKLGVKALHGDLTQGQRDGVMLAFKGGRVKVLVATDIAARGLDVEHVTHVVNYDVPNSFETYTHRIGRTGRVGRHGRAITLVEPSQRDELFEIERQTKMTLVEWGEAAATVTPASAAETDTKSKAPAEPDAVATEDQAPGDDEAEAATKAPARAKRQRRPRATAAKPDDAAETDDSSKRAQETPEPAPDAEPVLAVEAETEQTELTPEPETEPAVKQFKRPRHTKFAEGQLDTATTALLCGAGRLHGVSETDLVRLLAEKGGLSNKEIRSVRVFEHFSIARVPSDKAAKIAESANGAKLGDLELAVKAARTAAVVT